MALACAVVAAVAFFGNVGQASVEEQGQTIPIVVSTRTLDFGDLPLHDAVLRPLVLRNDGHSPLRARLVVGGRSFSVEPSDLILHPGVSSRVIVSAKASQLGDLEDRLQILIEDSTDSDLFISLAGRVREQGAGEAIPVTPGSSAARAMTVADRTMWREKSLSMQRGSARTSVYGTEAERAHEQPGPGGASEAAEAIAGGLIAGSKTEAAETDKERGRPDSKAAKPARERLPRTQLNGVEVRDYDPATSAPIRSIAELPEQLREKITDNDRERASRMPSTVVDENGDLPEELDDRPPVRESGRDEIEAPEDQDEPGFNVPTLVIDSRSTIRLHGTRAPFYPQAIEVQGTALGGQLALLGTPHFPTVYLAMSESIQFAASSAISGQYNAASGDVELRLQLLAVDADGDAAPLDLVLTTGVVYARDNAGNVVSAQGTPRVPATGMLRLVGLHRVPSGYENGVEEELVALELLAALDFGDALGGDRPAMRAGK